MSLLGWRVTSGEAQAPILKLDEPISFWGGIGDNGEIIDVHHPQHGAVVTGRILVMRSGRGSSSGTYVLAELLRLGLAPAAIILTEPDGIIATGALVGAAHPLCRAPGGAEDGLRATAARRAQGGPGDQHRRGRHLHG